MPSPDMSDPFVADPVAEAPVVDMTPFTDALREGFKSFGADIKDAVARQPAPVVNVAPPAATQVPTKSEPDPLRDAMMDVLQPILGSIEQKINGLASANAVTADAIAFNSDPRVTPEMRAAVEPMFQELARRGSPMSRMDVLQWQLGKQALNSSAQNDAARGVAASTATVGANSPSFNGNVMSPENTPYAKLKEATDNTLF